MGLSERKVKQRIGTDPRNLTWSADTDRFSYKHLTSLGWSDSSGIGGSDLSGNPNHIAVVHKLDNGGIGMGRARKEGEDTAAGAGQAGRGLEDVLKRLASAQSSAASSPVPETPVVEVMIETTNLKNKNASRQRHLHAKRLASSSPAALAEILGVPISSLSSPSPAPSTQGPSRPIESTPTPPAEPQNKETERTAEETVATSTLSVAEYFRQKMREKMLARQDANASMSSGSETPEGSLSRIKDDVKVAVGGVEWEGSKETFEEIQVADLEELAEAGPSRTVVEEKEGEKGAEAGPNMTVGGGKTAKKARKEAGRLKRLEEGGGQIKKNMVVPETTEESSTIEVKGEKDKKDKKDKKKRKESVDSDREDRTEAITKKRKREEGEEKGKTNEEKKGKKDKKNKETKATDETQVKKLKKAEKEKNR